MQQKNSPETELTRTEELNVRVAREHFAAESAHDTERTLATLAADIMYHVVASGSIVHGKEGVSKYYDVWWTAFPDVSIEVKRLVASGEWVIAENVVTAAHREAHRAALVRNLPDARRPDDRRDRVLRPARAHPPDRVGARARSAAARVATGVIVRYEHQHVNRGDWI